MTGGRALRVRLLGGLVVEGLTEHGVGSRKARTLLKRLAVERGSPVPVDTIADALWDDALPRRPADQVGVLVSRLRGVLGDSRIERVDAGYVLRADWLDVVELDARTAEAARRLSMGEYGVARAAAAAALELARGPLLPDEDASWVEPAREHLVRTVSHARQVAAAAALAVADWGAATAVAEESLADDSYDEVALRALMRAHAAAGRPSSALAAFARTRERLADDLGADPDGSTVALHTAILRGEASAPAVPIADVSQPPTLLVGRDAELAELDAAMLRGGKRAVLIEGEAGIGKTALVSAWVDRIGSRALVLRGRCDELGRDLPLQPVVDALAGQLRSLGAGGAELLGSERAALAPLLGVAPDAVTGTQVGDPDADRAALFAALLTVIERCGGDGPVIVALDDLHLAGASTLEWLAFALRRGTVGLIGTYRSERSVRLPGATVMQLGPLAPDAASALVGAQRAADLYRRSGGHPLFLLQLAESDGPELPASVRQAVVARVDGLGRATGDVLRAAAVLGLDVDLDLLAAVLRQPAVTLLVTLEHAARARLLVERGDTFAFAHDLMREAVVSTTSAARRAWVHREAAHVLVERPGHDPLDVAWHARLGGDHALAVDRLVAGATLAAARHDLSDCERLAGEALALAETPSARLVRARARLASGALVEAMDDVLAAVRAGGGPESLELAGWIAYYRRDYDAAGRYADEVVARSQGAALRSSALALAGRVRHAKGALAAAGDRLAAAVESATGTTRGVAAVWYAALLAHQGDAERAVLLVDGALVDDTAIGHPFAPLHARFARAYALGLLGRPTDALRALEDLDATIEARGAAAERFAPVAANTRAWILRSLGRRAEADDLNRLAADTPASSRFAEPRWVAHLDLIDSGLLAGDPDVVTRTVADATGVLDWHGTMDWHQHQRFGVLRARAALLAGDPASALELASSAAIAAEECGSPRYAVIGRLVAARAAAAAGDPPPLDVVETLLDRLPGVAGLEAWWITAEVAESFGVAAWHARCDDLLARLIDQAGPDADTLRRHAAQRLGRP